MRDETRKICSRESAVCKKSCMKEKCREGVIAGKCPSILGEIMRGTENQERVGTGGEGKSTAYVPLR